MKPIAAAGLMPIGMGNPALEAHDFDRIVAENRMRVLRFLFASVRDMDAAETLTQECFWKAYRSRASFRGECSVQTWLIRIAVNLVRDHSRRRRLRFWKNAEDLSAENLQARPDGGVSPEERTAINEQVRAVWEATKTLSERQRTVFLLRFVEDLDISEIAQAAGLTENAVNVHLFRAVRGIRKRLGHMQ